MFADAVEVFGRFNSHFVLLLFFFLSLSLLLLLLLGSVVAALVEGSGDGADGDATEPAIKLSGATGLRFMVDKHSGADCSV